MNSVLRAFLISAAATGVAAVVTYAVKPRTPLLPPAEPPRQDTVDVEADRFTDEQRALLMEEMTASQM